MALTASQADREFRVLAVNPGSTSTKIAVFHGLNEVFTTELKHSVEDLAPYDKKPMTAQFEFRRDAILKALFDHGMSMNDIDAVSGRGGLLAPIAHGTYPVNELMISELMSGVYGEHASNLGGLIAKQLVGDSGKPAFIVDPVVVDELPARVKITGIKAIRRRAISHALNQIASCQRFARESGGAYEKLNIIVAHMGGGISIGAHKKGCYIDVNDALEGEGPFSPQRAGSLPTAAWMRLILSGKYTPAELKMLVKGRGGLVDLLGTADVLEVLRRIDAGDTEATEVFDAMCYQLAKAITALIPAFDGEQVDRVILTGGMARSRLLVEKISKYISATGWPVTVYAGENEMGALAEGALRVLNGQEKAREYTGRA
ncbi:MAG TPA: butyrate kinase [Myxococcota bacterium]|nr:butyrate kinase [Myxococcota bacterium]HNZ04358.1 butyrate kinase [Myxococcota bacterium]HOD06842.1 butyrate kinase [Myxococcota bacterium]HPB50567.1 butyrate kinase [Myxococcota bacterium]HQP95782.1 butyrate kinase [Myxococcota bacterium]